MTFYERAWKERVRSEDKALLEHTMAMREGVIGARRTPSQCASSAFSVSTTGMKERRTTGQTPLPPISGASPAAAAGSTRKDAVAASVGTSLHAIAGTVEADRQSVRSTARSSRTSTSARSQLSHQSPSTQVSGLTEMNKRIALLEATLARERQGREEVHSELKEIKMLLLQQQGLRGKP